MMNEKSWTYGLRLDDQPWQTPVDAPQRQPDRRRQIGRSNVNHRPEFGKRPGQICETLSLRQGDEVLVSDAVDPPGDIGGDVGAIA
ncbi:hypothetical protein [Williamsia maris]|uniref:hypothetical protein n=1 Tax=Williamsia maris TaxID=72806 RepID=UPI0020A41601|nr:hypothetical protein [Williamsia maris]